MGDDLPIRFRAGRMPAGPATLQLLALGAACSKAFFSAIELGVFRVLAENPASPGELAARLSISERGTATLLVALAALRVVDRTADGSGRYLLAAWAAPALTSRAWVHHARHLQPLLDGLPHAVCTGEPQPGLWPFAAGSRRAYYDVLSEHPAEYDLFLEGMDASAKGEGEAIAARVDLTGVRHLADLGGGGGQIARELLRAIPELMVTIVDQPMAVACAARRAQEQGLGERSRFVAADLLTEELNLGHVDAVHLGGVLSDFNEQSRQIVLARARESLAPGGLLIVGETVTVEGVGPLLPALVSLYLLVATGSTNFDAQELCSLVRRAGFRDAQLLCGAERGTRDLVVARR
jgi:precorrin-6B methylase 2